MAGDVATPAGPGRASIPRAGLFLGASLVILVYAAAASISLSLGPPAPAVHDEFSNLLLADTLAHGRFTNPPHPLWKHFESFHIIQQPTYASKYPPAQGAFLALARLIEGRPVIGVWTSLALAALASYWMLAAWLPYPWAFAGALLMFSRPSVLTWWGDSYWGGAVSALGGALLYGGLLRLQGRARKRDAFAMGMGLLILALSRPFEGLLVSLPVVVWLCVLWIRARRTGSASAFALRVGLPLALCCLTSLTVLGAYDYAVTGKAWLPPYVVHENTYSYVPLLCGGARKPEPQYRHEVIGRFYATYAASTYDDLCVSPDRWRNKRVLLDLYVRRFYLGWLLWLPACAALATRRSEAWLAAAGCLCVLTGNLASSGLYPHYFAPAMACLGGLVAFGLHRMDSLCARWHLGRVMTLAIVAITLGSSVIALRGYQLSGGGRGRLGFAKERAWLAAALKRLPGDDLVVVRYAPEHNVHDEWVYNDADIDASPVVWARAMSDTQDTELLKYFASRCTWQLFADAKPPALRPYALQGYGRDCSR